MNVSPIEFMSAAIKFGGIKRNLETDGTVSHKDIMTLYEMTEKLLESHSKQVAQELRLLKEISELKEELGKGDAF